MMSISTGKLITRDQYTTDAILHYYKVKRDGNRRRKETATKIQDGIQR